MPAYPISHSLRYRQPSPLIPIPPQVPHNQRVLMTRRQYNAAIAAFEEASNPVVEGLMSNFNSFDVTQDIEVFTYCSSCEEELDSTLSYDGTVSIYSSICHDCMDSSVEEQVGDQVSDARDEITEEITENLTEQHNDEVEDLNDQIECFKAEISDLRQELKEVKESDEYKSGLEKGMTIGREQGRSEGWDDGFNEGQSSVM